MGPSLPPVGVKREIINIALGAGCELITALGTHQHTRSPALCCYTFPEVEMSSFTVITFLPPLTIDYLHFSIFGPAVKKCPHDCVIILHRSGRGKCQPLRFREGHWERGTGQRGHRETTTTLHCTLPAH